MTTPVFDAYQIELQKRGYTSDPAQLAAVAELERCAAEWSTYKAKRSNALARRQFHQPAVAAGDIHQQFTRLRPRQFQQPCM